MRRGEWTGETLYQAPGFVQANLVVLPRSEAYDFLLFCGRNEKACPVLEVTDTGNTTPQFCAPEADLRTDLLRYAIYRDGVRKEDRTEIMELWRDDFVAFLIGSGMTFDEALRRAGVFPYRDKPHWIVTTELQTVPAGKFRGPIIATMRWMTPQQAHHYYSSHFAFLPQSRRADSS
jgi:uncharacterized protein YcsI (UPF0317 family)